jgi:hypothetical protein
MRPMEAQVVVGKGGQLNYTIVNILVFRWRVDDFRFGNPKYEFLTPGGLE